LSRTTSKKKNEIAVPR